MRKIKALPEAVRSSIRSGVVLYDLSRVVEELVFNSLDAGATKVSVSVGVGSCFVKVADNGSGIDRDGLVLLGERYATSKHDHLADLDINNENFGFRGEALCSISDVSLLEIVTKAHGRPHGYRKVMKCCKSLHLGIQDDRHDVGTTVIARDIFYNQPVRRKHMQSSPKKVLQSVKKCVLRIALVHSRGSFKVFDIESQDELLSTCSSPSPLPLLSTNFGVEAASSLIEVKASEGELKLSGYLSGPVGILSLKAFQYIYINSRFVDKGPIHKLLNQLAAVYGIDKMYKICGRPEKQTRSLTCPTFILNLSCPRSHYDITFEPLKSSVEFRDWGPILAFIQDTVTHFWSENTPDELPEYCETKRKRSRTQKQPSGLEVPSRESEEHNKESNNLRASRDFFSSCQVSNGEPSDLKKHKKYPFLSNGVDSAVHSYDTSMFAGGLTTNRKIHNDMLLSGDLYSDEDNYLVNQLPKKDCCSKQVDYFVDPKWQRGSFEMDDKMTTSIRSPLYAHEFRDDADVNQLFSKPCKLSCLKGMSLQDVEVSFENETGSEFNCSGFNMRRKWVDTDEDVDVGDQDDTDQIFQETLPWHSIGKPSWLLSRCTNQHDKAKLNSLSHDVNTSLVPGECSDEENYLVSHPLEHRVSSTSELFPRISSSLFGQTPDADHFVDEDVHCKYDKGTGCDYLQDQEGEYFNFDINTVVNWSDTKNCTDFSPNCKLYAGLQGDFREVRGHKLKDSSFANCSDVLPDDMNWLHSSPHGKGSLLNSSDPWSQTSLCAQLERNKYGRIQIGNKETQFHQREAKRSHSAPPFHKRRRKCFHLNNLFKIQDGQMSSRLINDDTTFPEISDPKHELRASAQCDFPSKASYVGDFLCVSRLENEELQKKGQWFGSCISKQVEDSVSEEIEDVSESGLKWRKSCQKAGVSSLSIFHPSQNAGDQSTILDVSSGILHLAGDSLVPCSIDKNFLREAKVLQQVDKKFIPVVAGSILAIIDQHAADERIRLEELRKKVLSGEMKQITYLEAEQELVLPEIGYQLLHNYVEQIQSWGWICDFSGPGSRSFAKKLNVLCRQPTAAKLVAVPCILGVSLTDNDLLEFLQQLSDTDGSSTIPPSVLRVLNNKACRGAIMFGDTLLPSECSLIVEELKQTTLCLQCAHGRPTTVPLVNLEALHKQIDKLELCRKGTQGLWHGLCRHEISLDRAAYRLSSATI